ncbi:MAG: SpaA isopeptide-forming pilin-related protein, partial [Clostridiales bacterium]|nr:SpaA isopeptide-forming pilin-related protein [Clostridiales bacterium]
GSGGSQGHEVSIDNSLVTYITDGQDLKIQAIIKAQDAADGCQFVGTYYTRLDEDGNPVSDFIQVVGNEIEDTGSLTDEEKKGKWVRSVQDNGDIVYTYYLENITTATDLHFVFIKNPTVTYDSNGGYPYVISDRPHPEEEDENVYSFKPEKGDINEESFQKPYVSQAATGYEGWKFMGWKMLGDIVDNIPSDIELVNAEQGEGMLLPAVHSIACDFKINGITEADTTAQLFKIYDGNISFNKTVNTGELGYIFGVTWNDGGATKLYANVHRGITMVAQWRWIQAFIPQLVRDGVSINSTEGGTVEITSVTDPTDENYNDAYTEAGGKAYYAAMDETVLVKAVANPGCTFLGWYDKDGNLISTNTEYGYVETKESVKTYYARFSNTVTQTYIRQIKNGDSWENTTDDKIGTLGRYSYVDAVGSPISSTANVGAGYKFMGWYDSEGNKVPSEMLTNNGKTIEYITTGDATYYARYERAYTLYISKVDEDDGDPLVGAEFTLYQMDENGDQTITYDGTSIKCIKIGSDTTELTKDGAKALAIFTDTLLTGRDYYVVETKPPFGYNIINGVTKISFVDTNADENGILTIEIANQIGIQLPTAGGIGTVMFNVIGVLMICVAIFLLVLKKEI